MLDLCAGCIAVVTVPDRADYMGFKYFAPLYMKLSTDPVMTPAEQQLAKAELEKLLNRVPAITAVFSWESRSTGTAHGLHRTTTGF
jgi:hypothetical protein